MTVSMLRKLSCPSGLLVLLDPGGDEPAARGYATRIYTGSHVLHVEPGAWWVGRDLADEDVAAVTLKREDAGGYVKLRDAQRALVVQGGRLVIADGVALQAHDRAVRDGTFRAADTDGVVILESFTRARLRMAWDEPPPRTRYIRLEPPSA